MERGGTVNNGIFIDIHPFIPLPNNNIVDRYYCIIFKVYKHLLLAKSGARQDGQGKRIIYFLSQMTSKSFLIKKIYSIFDRFSSEKCDRAYKISGRHLDRDYILIDNLRHLKNIQFEGYNFTVMPDYDRMLNAVYGDYLNETPSGDTENRHGIIEVDFGDYIPKTL